MCAINRMSMYILLSILINLCALTYQLVALIAGGSNKHKMNQGALNVLSTAVPILLGILGYALEVDIGEGENAQLNTVHLRAHFAGYRFVFMTVLFSFFLICNIYLIGKACV
jgi:hypothetical protein